MRNSAPSEATDKPVIYAVDDEVMILELFSLLLEPMGYQVLTFPDPVQALKAFAATAKRPALIITDYAMHALNGIEVTAKCRAIEPGQKVLLASGTVDQTIVSKSPPPSRPDRFITKPFKMQELISAVRELVGR